MHIPFFYVLIFYMKSYLKHFIWFTLITFLFFAPLIFSKDFVFGRDFVHIDYLKLKFLKIHGITLWNTLNLCGYPGIVQHPNFTYIFNLLIFFLRLPLFLKTSFLFHFSLLFSGLYFFLKTLNLNKGAFIGSIIFCFSLRICAKIYAGHYLLLHTFSYGFFSCAFFLKYIKTHKFYYLIFSSIFLSLSIISGHQQFASYFILLIIFIIIFFKPKLSSLYAGSFVICMALLIASYQLFPLLEALKFSPRYKISSDLVFATSFHLPLKHLVCFFIPYIFGNPAKYNYIGRYNFWELCCYAGIIPIIFVFSINHVKEKTKYFSMFLIIFGIIMAISPAISPLRYIYTLKIFSIFRAPARFLFFTLLGLTIITAYCFNNLSSVKNKIRQRGIIVLLCGLIVYVIFALILKTSSINFLNPGLFLKLKIISYFGFQNLSFILGILFLLLLGSFAFTTTRRFRYLLIILILMDSFFHCTRILKPADRYSRLNPSNLNQLKKVFKFEAPPYRVLALTTEFPATWIANLNLETPAGYVAILLDYYMKFCYGKVINTDNISFASVNEHLFKLLNIKFLIVKNNQKLNKQYLTLYQSDKYKILHFKNGFPRYRAVSSLSKTYPDIKSSFKLINYTPDKIILNFTLSKDGYMVSSDVNYPGWKAKVDGRPAKMAYYLNTFKALNLKKGNHIINFYFLPETFITGSIVSITVLFLLFFTLIILIKKERKLL